jgi:hypothetical protein
VTRAILLGPLGPDAALARELVTLDVDGPVALITAGWEEGERSDAEVDRWLGGGTRNLGLFGRRLDVLDTDGEYAAAERALQARLAELRELYLLRLKHALAGADAIRRRFAGSRKHAGNELDEALSTVRALDDRHAAAVAAARGEFYAAFPPHERASIQAHRDAVAAIVAECAAVAVAGGHVGVLNNCLHLCNIGALLGERPLLAWSSGCMAVAERIVVIDDTDPSLRPDEVLDAGISAVRGVIPIADAKTRLRRRDRERLSLLARRCAPRVCVLLDQGDRLAWDDEHLADLRAVRVLAPDGAIRSGALAA